MRLLFRTLQLFALFTAFLVEAAVVYLVDDPMTRVLAGTILILPIVWIVARTDVVEMIKEIPDAAKERRFTGLRAKVMQLLTEIRRLNWLAVDAERGFRNEQEAMREMDRIENRLKEIISEIRGAAGQSDARSDSDTDAETDETGTVEETADVSADRSPARPVEEPS